MEVDIRSEGAPELEALEAELTRLCEEATAAEPTGESRRARPGRQGDRPEASRLHRRLGSLVRAAMEATRLLGGEPELIASSTDANIPMSLGIPAITLGAGGLGGGIHTPEEWYQNRKGPEGIFRALLTLLLHA